MITRFHRDERAYEKWLKRNPEGFVFNYFGGTNPWENLLHQRGCDHLWRPEDRGRRTIVEKVCSDELEELQEEADRLRGARQEWKRCSACM